MTRYEYIEEVKNNIIDYIKENYDEGDQINKYSLYDDLFISDSVTGNASGSYYCNSYKAREALGSDLVDIVEEIEANFGPIDHDKMYDWEYLDVSYRCVLLGEALEEAISELEEEFQF